MTYTVLARKYRPQRFSELEGQDHVTRTLGNAIESQRVAHAFLFTGVRGVGKTTSARLLAKSLNCAKGPTKQPCNRCDACGEITLGVDVDVLEIDGASNNSVDDVRRLQESLPYRPQRDRYKVVIVDEVHMLSQGAFNAFLKTLEEPPQHVKFIFATTEVHKVPVTVRSRCQRYDFRLIPRSVISGRVREVLKLEGIEADDRAISLVAREAAGSMRDALTLLDQVVAFSGDRLVGEEVARGLGIANRQHLLDVARALSECNAAAALGAAHELGHQGIDPLHFVRQLTSMVRDLVVLCVAGDSPELVDLTSEERSRALELARQHDARELERLFAGVSRLVDEVGRSATPMLILEMGLVRLADRTGLEPVSELVGKLRTLEAKLLGDSGPAPTSPASTASRGLREANPARASGRSATEAKAPQRTGRPVRGQPAERPPEQPRTSAAHEDAKPDRTPTSQRGGDAGPPPPQPPERAAPAGNAPLRGGGNEHLWVEIVRRLRDSRPALAALLEHAAPVEIGPERIVIAFPAGSFHARQAAASEARQAAVVVAEKVLGQQPSFEIRTTAEIADPGTSVNQLEAKEREQRRQQQVERALSHPRVVEALKIFPEANENVDVRVDGD